MRGAGDDPATLDHAVLNQNILAGNMSGSSGPYLEFALEDAAGTRAELGEDLVPASDVVTLLIRVQASNWIPVDEVRVYKNGVRDRVFDGSTTPALRSAPKNPFSGGTNRVVRFEAAVDVALDSDAYFVVEAGPKLDPLSPVDETVAKVVPGLRPLAFTNPIFVDLAGDGFDPPGVGTPAPIPAAASALFEAEKREQVRRHPSIYRIRIPESAAEAARARLSSP